MMKSKKRTVEIKEKAWPNPESVYELSISRPHHYAKYYIDEQMAKKVMEIIGHSNFIIELDGGAIFLMAFPDNHWVTRESERPFLNRAFLSREVSLSVL